MKDAGVSYDKLSAVAAAAGPGLIGGVIVGLTTAKAIAMVHGLISREAFRQAPPRVEYAATELGRSLAPIILSLCEWGRHHAAELDEIDRLAECQIGLPARRIAQLANAPSG